MAEKLPTIRLLHRNVCDEFFNICLKNRSFTVKKAYDILKNRFWRPWIRILRVNENPKPECRFYLNVFLVQYNCFGVVKSDEGREIIYASSWYCLLVGKFMFYRFSGKLCQLTPLTPRWLRVMYVAYHSWDDT